jgi:hypothetical protein
MIVTFDELRQISRRQSRRAVRAWLSENKIAHGIGADGVGLDYHGGHQSGTLGPGVTAGLQCMPLPPGVTEKHGRYYVVRKNKWHPLTRIDEGEVALLEAYYELTKADPHNMAGVLLAFREGTAWGS